MPSLMDGIKARTRKARSEHAAVQAQPAPSKRFRTGDRVRLVRDADGYLGSRLGLVPGESLGTVADLRVVDSQRPVDSCMVVWDEVRLNGLLNHESSIRCGFDEIDHHDPPAEELPMAEPGYKIVPLDADQKTVSQKAQELREHLASNVAVKIHDGELEKAAVFQQHLDTLDVLIEHSRDRVSRAMAGYDVQSPALEKLVGMLGEAIEDAGTLPHAASPESVITESPCLNTAQRYENSTFAIRAFCWCDGWVHPETSEGMPTCPPNFEHFASGVRGEWHKALGRSTRFSRSCTDQEAQAILDDCLASLPVPQWQSLAVAPDQEQRAALGWR